MKFNPWFLISSTVFLALVQSAVAYDPVDVGVANIDAQIKDLKKDESRADRKAMRFSNRAARSRANCNYNREDIRIRKRDAADLDASRYRAQIQRLEEQRDALLHPSKKESTVDASNSNSDIPRDPNGIYDANGNPIGFIMNVTGAEFVDYGSDSGPGQGPGKWGKGPGQGPTQGPGQGVEPAIERDPNDDVVYEDRGNDRVQADEVVIDDQPEKKVTPKKPSSHGKPSVTPKKPNPGINDRKKGSGPGQHPKKGPGQGPGRSPGKGYGKGPGQAPTSGGKVNRSAWDDMMRRFNENQKEAQEIAEKEKQTKAAEEAANRKKIQEAIDAELKKAQEEHQQKVDACAMTVITDRANYRVRRGRAVFKGVLKLENCDGQKLQMKKKARGQDVDVAGVLQEYTVRPSQFLQVSDKAVSNKVDKTVLGGRGNELQYSENVADEAKNQLSSGSAQ
jgi:hypothetical protein